MIRKGAGLFIIVETPLHVGAGAELGIVDLPIQRERHTGWPKIEASGLKGALREAIPLEDELKNAIFGPLQGNLHAGSIVLTDARILLFPVKSGRGTFAWVISPEAFARFRKDIEALALLDKSFYQVFEELPQKLDENTVHENSALTVEVKGEKKVLLEEYSFNVEVEHENIEKFVKWLQKYVFKQGNVRYEDIPKKLCVVDNDMFNDLVKMFTEVITRTRIDPVKGVVATNALWNEEYLPSETVMYSLMMTTPLAMSQNEKPEELKDENPENEAQKLLDKIIENLPPLLFLGGNETIGKGLVRLSAVRKEG